MGKGASEEVSASVCTSEVHDDGSGACFTGVSAKGCWFLLLALFMDSRWKDHCGVFDASQAALDIQLLLLVPGLLSATAPPLVKLNS